MKHTTQNNTIINQLIQIGLWGALSIGLAFSQHDIPDSLRSENFSMFRFSLQDNFIVNPFPTERTTLVQPLDSIVNPLGIILFPDDNSKSIISLSQKWNNIIIIEEVDGNRFLIPFSADIEWYLITFRNISWHNQFINIMQKEFEDDSRRKRGQMIEVVGMDMGRLGRASLQVSGNVNINGKMVFQDQELKKKDILSFN